MASKTTGRFEKLLWVGLLLFTSCSDYVNTCRVGSEQLKAYARETIERLLDADQLESIYWPEGEPLDAGLLSRALGINVTVAETYFGLINGGNQMSNSINGSSSARSGGPDEPLIRDVFVTCVVDRDRNYALSMNLELSNPFKVVEAQFELPPTGDNSNNGHSGKSANAMFRVILPQSSFLVHLKQRIRYDECLVVNYVQLAPNVSYELECVGCNEEQQVYLQKVSSKRMTQLDAQLDSMLSEKLLLGLQVLFNQQRLDLDLFVD